MNSIQQKALNKAKGDKVKSLMKKLGQDEFNERYTGAFKGHVSKLKRRFNIISFGTKNHRQVDSDLSLWISTNGKRGVKDPRYKNFIEVITAQAKEAKAKRKATEVA